MCEDGRTLAVVYINAGPVSLAVLTMDDPFVMASNVIAASSARYAGGPHVWWSHGTEAFFENIQEDGDAAPVTCTARSFARIRGIFEEGIGWGTRIRTWTNGVRVRCSTVKLSPKRSGPPQPCKVLVQTLDARPPSGDRPAHGSAFSELAAARQRSGRP